MQDLRALLPVKASLPEGFRPSSRSARRVKNALPAPEVCPFCESCVSVQGNAVIYHGRTYGEWPWIYWCKDCGASVGMHPGTDIPLGTLATPAIKAARVRAKDMFNPLWQSGEMTRSEAYAWLAGRLGIPVEQCHFGWFDCRMCERAEFAILAR